jgi:hypothetical protein
LRHLSPGHSTGVTHRHPRSILIPPMLLLSLETTFPAKVHATPAGATPFPVRNLQNLIRCLISNFGCQLYNLFVLLGLVGSLANLPGHRPWIAGPSHLGGKHFRFLMPEESLIHPSLPWPSCVAPSSVQKAIAHPKPPHLIMRSTLVVV